MARALKVFRTPIGFHDAYVAAPSQKAALEAWGSDADLFSRGVAERVTDEALMREPLDSPGQIIRRPRGTAAEHMAALPKEKPAPKRQAPKDTDDSSSAKRKGASAGRVPKDTRKVAPVSTKRTKTAPAPKPKPSRAHLDDAEAALAQAEAERDRKVAELRRREQALQKERQKVELRLGTEIAKREAALTKAEGRYRAALAKWRG